MVDTHSGGGVGRFVRQVARPASSLHGCAAQRVRRAMSVDQMYIEAGSAKKIDLSFQGPDCTLTSTQTCMSYANTHFFQISAFSCPYLVKYVDSWYSV